MDSDGFIAIVQTAEPLEPLNSRAPGDEGHGVMEGLSLC